MGEEIKNMVFSDVDNENKNEKKEVKLNEKVFNL